MLSSGLAVVALALGGPAGAVASGAVLSGSPTARDSTMEVQLADSGDGKAPTGAPISRERSVALDQVLAANSSAALIMFLIKNPDDPFAEQARVYLRARLAADSEAKLRAAAGSQTPVVAAFDTARLQGTKGAWDAFLARYGDHPLSAEVDHFR